MSRSSILASFPGLPSGLADSSPSLSGSRLSGLRRAQRAWICGNWAGAVLAGRIATPNRSPALGVPSRFYCVLLCPGLETPRVFTSYQRFASAVGRLEGTSTACQGDPTEQEARIYSPGSFKCEK